MNELRVVCSHFPPAQGKGRGVSDDEADLMRLHTSYHLHPAQSLAAASKWLCPTAAVESCILHNVVPLLPCRRTRLVAPTHCCQLHKSPAAALLSALDLPSTRATSSARLCRCSCDHQAGLATRLMPVAGNSADRAVQPLPSLQVNNCCQLYYTSVLLGWGARWGCCMRTVVKPSGWSRSQ
jgi:hypothetical protein